MRASLLVLLLSCGISSALEPKQILVIANKTMPESVDVAKHYMKLRAVPEANLFLVDVPKTEGMTRAEYDSQLAEPLRKRLAATPSTITCLLTVYGVPLSVGPQLPTAAEAKELAEVRAELATLRKELEALQKATPKEQAKIDAVNMKINTLNARDYKLNHGETNCAVDSELMLLLHPSYDLFRVTPNPLYRFMPQDKAKALAPKTLMTCRLDAPTPEIAKRLVDDAVAVEKAGGLKGKVYFDARGLKYDATKPNQYTGYEGYDEAYREAAALLKDAGYDVTLDDQEAVFAKDTCPDAALYSGWYSPAKFVASNKFVKGAIAWHLASYELNNMRQPNELWVANVLKSGACVTIGPVGEPYTIAFPKPPEFFGLLVTGKYTVVECYAKSVYFASWMNVLIGDPLYNPYKTTGTLDENKIQISPKGMPNLFK